MQSKKKSGLSALLDKPLNKNTGAASSEPTLQNISLLQITPSKTNPRRSFDEESIRDLAESMRPPIGLLQPITLRPQADGFEIVAGERRYHAAQLLGWETITAFVRDISDEEMLEFQILENLQREDVSPLDEAHAFKTLLQKESIDWLASRIHKTKKYIMDRLKLNDLIPDAMEYVSKNILPLGHAVIISKLSFADQKSCLSKCINNGFGENTDDNYCKTPLEELKDFISDTIMLEFKKAPFDPDDAILYETAGACKVCPKRTCNSNLLFNDITRDDKCTDASCFHEKIKLHIEREKSKAKEQYGKVLSGEKTNYGGRNEIKVQGVTVPFSETPIKNSIPVVLTKIGTYDHDRSNLGKTVYIDAKKIDQLKVAKEDSKNSNGRTSSPTETYDQRQLRELKENWPRLEFAVKNYTPVQSIINEFLKDQLESVSDRSLYAFAGLTHIEAGLTTPEMVHERVNKERNEDECFKRRAKVFDQLIAVYSVEDLIMIIMFLDHFDDEEDAETDRDYQYGFTWPELLNEITPQKKTAKKSKSKAS